MTKIEHPGLNRFDRFIVNHPKKALAIGMTGLTAPIITGLLWKAGVIVISTSSCAALPYIVAALSIITLFASLFFMYRVIENRRSIPYTIYESDLSEPSSLEDLPISSSRFSEQDDLAIEHTWNAYTTSMEEAYIEIAVHLHTIYETNNQKALSKLYTHFNCLDIHDFQQLVVDAYREQNNHLLARILTAARLCTN